MASHPLPMQIVDVTAGNVADLGFFCYKSKPKSAGYQRKLAWLRERFAEGLRMKLVLEGERSVGFIESIPGEYSWRAVQAAGYMLIHCLWVVGRAKGRGYGSRLLDACIADARSAGMAGVATVTSSGYWLAGQELFLKHGFAVVDRARPGLSLMALRFGAASPPSFPRNWAEQLAAYGDGLTILRSDQCPYIDASVHALVSTAQSLAIPCRVIEIEDCRQAQQSAPSAYGVFNVVYNGKLIAHHPIGGKVLRRILGAGVT